MNRRVFEKQKIYNNVYRRFKQQIESIKSIFFNSFQTIVQHCFKIIVQSTIYVIKYRQSSRVTKIHIKFFFINYKCQFE